MKIIAITPHPDLIEIVKDTFQLKNDTDYICFSIPPDFDQNDIYHITNFFRTKVFKNIKNPSKNIHINQILSNDQIFIEILDIKDKPQNCLDLSIYYQYMDSIIVRSGILDQSLKQNIGEMTGVIVDFFSDGQEDIFKIRFGIQALSGFSENKLKFLIERKISPFYTYLSPDQILPSGEHDSEVSIQERQVQTLLKYAPEKIKSYWDSPLNNIFYDEQKPIFEYWENFLRNRFDNQNEITGTTFQNETVKILSTAGSDEKNGVSD